ncbi:MAG: DUF4162 domain-containing protein, partial [Acidimicrobiales bacterium]|nr:DUF4162 domain-containing protein [Acidimicrobiales bacterium]
KMEVTGWKPEMTGAIQSLAGIRQMVTRFLEQDGIWEIHLQTENSRAVLPHLIERVNTNGTHLVNLNIVAPTLEDVFIHLTGKALRD